MWIELESQLFSVVSLGVEQLLSQFPVFLDCLFPGPLMRETRLWGGLHFCMLLLSFPGCWLYLFQVWDIWRGGGKTTRIHHCTIPWVPGSLDICLLLFTFRVFLCLCFPGGSAGKKSACKAGDPGPIPGSGRSLEKEMANHTSIIAWKIPGTEEPWGLQSMSQRVRHNWEANAFTTLSCLC